MLELPAGIACCYKISLKTAERKKMKKLENLEQDLKKLDEQIKNYQNKITKLKQNRQMLEEKIEITKLFEIQGLLKEREISFEQAKVILKQSPVIPERNTNEKTSEVTS